MQNKKNQIGLSVFVYLVFNWNNLLTLVSYQVVSVGSCTTVSYICSFTNKWFSFVKCVMVGE